MSPSTSEMRSSTRPTPPTMRNGRSNAGASLRANPAGERPRVDQHYRRAGAIASVASSRFAALESGGRRMPDRDRVNSRIAADAAHQADHLVNGVGGQCPAHDAMRSERIEAARAYADHFPSDLPQGIVLVEI